MKKNINGQEITYGDVIYHTTFTKLKFWDRVNALFGKRICTYSEIYINRPAQVVFKRAVSYIETFKKEPGVQPSKVDISLQEKVKEEVKKNI